ncbi:MAG: response regulator [Deltaproteobacteria bacterium]|nr:response regulator [Deltaproteobacteria bacterium]MCB9785624.1 response regulator [Deltaproteobacteria bacterium]
MTAPRILVVDDSLTVRMHIGEALQDAEFDVVLCADLEAARAALRASSCQLVILDLNLPDGHGLDLLAEMRAAPETASVPVLLLSAEEEAGLDARAHGVEYVGKPYELEAVVARVRVLCRRRPDDASAGTRRILVIDDSPTYRNQVKDALQAAGYQVYQAGTGEEGLAMLTELRPDAIVVDGVLPGVDGATVVHRVKSDLSLRRTPCLLLTAAERTEDELRSLEAGADAYVRKSEDLEVLLARVAALLRRTRSETPHTMPSLLGPKRLLAIDDSPTYLHTLGDQLRSEGYETILASSGEEGLAVLAERPVDGILLDLMMPGLSGEETCRRIKQDPELRDIPLMILTARDERDAMIQGINAGADDYIAKSADFDVLKARLRAQLRRKHFEDENRRIREQLVRREAEARLQRLVHSNIIGVIFGNVDGQLTDANDAFLEMLGYSREDLDAGRLRAEILTPPDWRKRDAAVAERLRAEGSVASYEKELLRKDGSRLPIVLGQVLLEDGETSVGFVLDRTEQKRAEEDIARYTLALEEANRELSQAKEQAEQSSRYKSSFLANMSHELRTPLNAIIGFAELLHDGVVSPEDPEHKEFLGDILTSGQHLLQLINDVLDLSKVEAGKLLFHAESVALGELVREVLTVLRTSATDQGILVTTELDPGCAQAFIDPARFKQVLYNYVSNALKFTPGGGSVEVRLRPEGEWAFRLEVEDTGIGVAPEDVGRLFAEFQQLDGGAAKRHAGTGLGLALTKRLVEAQGGFVGVHTVKGEGSTFFAVLPRRAPEERSLPAPRRYEAPEQAPAVLVADGDEAEQGRLARALIAAGCSVETVAAGTQALWRCRERAFDAVAMSLRLPDVSGFEVVHAIRELGRAGREPRCVLTVATRRGAVAGVTLHDAQRGEVCGAALRESLDRAGVRPGASVMVVGEDAGGAGPMAGALAGEGFVVVAAASGSEALELVAAEAPAAVLLQLWGPSMDAFELLAALRAQAPASDVPAVVCLDGPLGEEEHARLRGAADTALQHGAEAGAVVLGALGRASARDAAAGE